MLLLQRLKSSLKTEQMEVEETFTFFSLLFFAPLNDAGIRQV